MKCIKRVWEKTIFECVKHYLNMETQKQVCYLNKTTESRVSSSQKVICFIVGPLSCLPSFSINPFLLPTDRKHEFL